MHTSDLLVGAGLTTVLALGDTQYADAELDEFQLSYDPSWGRVKSITRPVLGNHEYRTDGDPGGYFDYFNGVGEDDGRAGERGKGYYSFDIGTSWHLVALNSQCNRVPGGCAAGSAQEQWLRADLAANTDASCTLAYWHHPQFHSGPNPNDFDTTPFWQALYEANADLILNGHRHSYERFAPQDPQGNADPEHGLREFIVGTGGHSHADAEGPVKPNSLIRDRTQFGVLMLVLHPNSYDWEFVNELGVTTDAGSGGCHGTPGDGPTQDPGDAVAPETAITSGPPETTTSTDASFAITASESGARLECRLDSGNWMGCGSPAAYGGLATGAHTFEARAIDAAGNTDATPASWNWSITRLQAEAPALGWHRHRPASYELLSGRVRGKRGVRRLRRDDGKRLVVAAEKRPRKHLAAFRAVVPLGTDVIEGLRLRHEGSATAGARVRLHVFDYRARRWVKPSLLSAGPDDFISRRGNARIRVKGKGAEPFRTLTDLVGLAARY